MDLFYILNAYSDPRTEGILSKLQWHVLPERAKKYVQPLCLDSALRQITEAKAWLTPLCGLDPGTYVLDGSVFLALAFAQFGCSLVV
jgi:hypothetical protein